ncbi:P-loop containing nucleoside triphosphate hydrolase protein [Infundibulicybe gibba]|nr:P-loop containing nucleoside triphosphate hydrolase protein [Infundibulicybe gibba]
MFRTHGCIVACLRERFMADTIHTNIGSSALVALNPHKYVSTSADSIMHKYAAEYRDTSEHREKLPPHIFQTANNAYYHMKRTTQDQCLVFSAETGSGKSENRRLAIKTLLELSISNPGKKGSKVAGPPSGERNFHIFYYLIAGASPEERQHLHLLDKTTYRYLGQRTAPRANGGRDDDAVRFDQLKVALKTIGLSKRHVAQTCQLIAAILHLGNLEFTIDRHCNEDAAVVRNTDVLDIVSDFLGVSPSTLESALSCKTKLVKKELCTVFLDLDGASDNRDELFETLDETQSWYIFCVSPNDSQLPNQPEGRSVKGQVRSVGLAEIARRNINVFEVGMTPDEFCERYKESLDAIGVSEGSEQERVEQARTAFGVDEKDIVLGQSKV